MNDSLSDNPEGEHSSSEQCLPEPQFVDKITSIPPGPWLGDSGFVQVLLSPSTSLIKPDWNLKLAPDLSSIAIMVLLLGCTTAKAGSDLLCKGCLEYRCISLEEPGAEHPRDREQSYTPVIVCALFLCSHKGILGHIMCLFLLRCFCSLRLSPLPKLFVTVLEQEFPLGQTAGKLSGDHEHFDAFAAVFPA